MVTDNAVNDKDPDDRRDPGDPTDIARAPAAPGAAPGTARSADPASSPTTNTATVTTTQMTRLEAGTEQLLDELDEERPTRTLPRLLNRAVLWYCFGVAAFVLFQVFSPLPQGKQFSLISFLALTLPLAFLLYRSGSRGPGDRPSALDWVLAAATAVVCWYPIAPVVLGDGGGGFNAFLDRQGSLSTVDVIAGAVLTVLLLEATRRTTGWVLPIVCMVFFLFAYYGGYLPWNWAIAHQGVNFDQIINGFFNDQSGFYGTPLGVAATYIVLFIIYGSVLQATGAGRFFIDFSFSLFRKSKSAAGRTVVTSGFLLGTVSGSGTATAVTLGSLAWPILQKAGYPRENAGGMLAAAGIGAILSPPTLGAAAFIIAEYLQVSYLQVMVWALVPTVLYYAGIFLAVEIDARRFGVRAVNLPRRDIGRLVARFGYHFLSLAVIVVFLAMNIAPFRAIVYATAVAALFGLIERVISRRDPLDAASVAQPLPRAVSIYIAELFAALASGIRASIPVVAVCAAAGIITSVIVKTGVGLTFAQLLVGIGEAASDNPRVVLAVTAILAALAISLLGLAVPVTASFIISWVVIGPALITLGVEPPEAAMFIFYYSVLSEVSPPTALAAVASAAITGGATIATMWQAMKYALPAFLAPLAFVLTPNGSNLLIEGGDPIGILWTTAISLVAVAALAGTTGGWILGPATWLERVLLLIGALCCLYLEPISFGIGLALIAATVGFHVLRRRGAGTGSTPESNLTTTERTAS